MFNFSWQDTCRYEQDLRFMWPEGAFWSRNNTGSWLSLIIYNMPNGVSRVEQNINGTCALALLPALRAC